MPGPSRLREERAIWGAVCSAGTSVQVTLLDRLENVLVGSTTFLSLRKKSSGADIELNHREQEDCGSTQRGFHRSKAPTLC